MYCWHCMAQLNTESVICPQCGKPPRELNPPHHLAAGTVLDKRILVGNAIGEGGFGITYVGLDLSANTKVAVKEFFPSGFANRNNEKSNEVLLNYSRQGEYFRKGKENFLREAHSIAKFSNERGVVDVREFFTENNTAYIVMEFLDGVNLSKYISQHNVFSPKEIIELMLPVMVSLERIHKEGVIHRDISPDNIVYLTDGSLKLTDFGSARYFSGDDETKSLSVVLKPGYAPHEQYGRKSSQGPWTDVYALCATLYKCITGITPVDAFSRAQHDDLKTPSELGVKIDRAPEAVIMHGLEIYPEDRYQNMGELINAFTAAIVQHDNPSTIVYHHEQPDGGGEAQTALAETNDGTQQLPEEEHNITYGDSSDYFQRVPKKQENKPLKPMPSSEYPPKDDGSTDDADDSRKSSKRAARIIALKASLVTVALVLVLIITIQIIARCGYAGNADTSAGSTVPAAKQTDEFSAALAQSRTFACDTGSFITVNKDHTASYYSIRLFSMVGNYVTDNSSELVNNENIFSVCGSSRLGYYGLRRDGTVVALKTAKTVLGYSFVDSEKFADEISEWRNVIQIASGDDFLVALNDDGNVLTAGKAPDVSDWENIAFINADGSTVLGLESSGVLHSSDTEKTRRGIASFCTDSVDFCIKKDGTVQPLSDSGSLPETGAWGNIISLSYRNDRLVGLKRDHTAVAVGENPPNLSEWSDIAAVRSASNYTLGKKSDGSFVIACNNASLRYDFEKKVNGQTTDTTAASSATHRVKFINYDGEVLKEEWVQDGQAATPPDDPVKPEDRYYRYRFKTWSPDYSRITGDVTIAPIFESVSKS